MAKPANPSKTPAKKKNLWQRFLELLVPPWIQVGATILCAGIVYLADLWVRPQAVRLTVEKQNAQRVRDQLISTEKKLPQEKGQDLKARTRELSQQTVDSDQDLQQLLREITQIVKKEAWRAKITPAEASPPTPEVPTLWAVPVVLEISVPQEYSESVPESDQARLLRLLRKMDGLKPRHQLIGLEIRSDLKSGFSAKLTYHFYRIHHG